MNIFKKWFAPLDEQNLEVKIKINPMWPSHYRCYGYWKLSSGFLWKSIGLIHESDLGFEADSLTEKDYDYFLDLAKKKVLTHLRNDGNLKKKLIIPIKDLDL